MDIKWYSAVGCRRGLVLALAGTCLWIGWVLGWTSSQSKISNPSIHFEKITQGCPECCGQDSHSV